MRALAALLDRSVIQIAQAADARTFDRQAIYEISDVWDNNTLPMFRAAQARTGWGRDRLARTALRWMADLGESRRKWMAEQAGIAGYELPEFAPLPPTSRRDYTGRVRPRYEPLTAQEAAEIDRDYDLPTAEVHLLRVERRGTRLIGALTIAADRRYRTDRDGQEPAELHVYLDDVGEIRFDADDATGVTFGSAEGAVGIGTRGRITAARATIWPNDHTWHLSPAGRRADAQEPRDRVPRPNRPPLLKPDLDGEALVAAHLVRGMMIEIRMVGHPHLAAEPPILKFCDVFAEAGTRVASTRRYRGLIEDWLRRGGPELSASFARTLKDLAKDGRLSQRGRDCAADLTPTTTPHPEPPAIPEEAQLRMAKYLAPHARHGIERAASADLTLAVEGDPWRLRAVSLREPARLRLRTEAFQEPVIRWRGEFAGCEPDPHDH